MWRLLWVAVIAAGCEPARVAPPHSSGPVVLHYQDFGPQVMAHELLGFECEGRCCCLEPDQTFDIRVVVQPGLGDDAITTGAVRTIDAGAALAYLDAHLADLSSWPAEERLPELEATLRATRAALNAAAHASMP